MRQSARQAAMPPPVKPMPILRLWSMARVLNMFLALILRAAVGLSRPFGPRCRLVALVAFVSFAVRVPASHAESGAVEVDAEIVLAVDISYSMDTEEQQLQRSGYIEALTSPEFFNALQSGVKGSIALTYVEWASCHRRLAFDRRSSHGAKIRE
jgi:hypothetical protein